MGISLEKIEREAPQLLSLTKKAVNSLSRFGLDGHSAKVALLLDHSGSMRNEYSNGSMQRLAEKALALGTQFDDDGNIDLFFFDSSAIHAGEITINDYQNSVDALRAGRRMGTTDYADAINSVREHYGLTGGGIKKGLFGKKSAPSSTALPVKEPIFVIFLTDGAPDSESAAVRAITEAADQPIFWKFISIGNSPIPFLQKLDDLPKRLIDNADYQPVGDVDRISDEALFDVLFEEYPQWLTAARGAGLIQ